MGLGVAEKLRQVQETLPSGVRLVAVSKYHPMEDIMSAYNEGQRIFGESHEQELTKKAQALPQDIEWHFIGHLQSNKVKFIAPYISMIEAVDSVKLLREINKQAAKCNRVIDVLLELHIAKEETKYGFTLDACREYLATGEWKEMAHVRIRGLMMMASYVPDEAQIEAEMMLASDFFDELKNRFFSDVSYFNERSWGMSEDYHIAVRCHSTLVRIGSAIFGERIYPSQSNKTTDYQ